MASKHDNLIKQYLSDDRLEQTVARMILVALGEEVVEDVVDTYYAGISVEQGLSLLKLLGAIGGYEALNTLRSIFKYEAEDESLKRAAAEGLIANADNLSPDEHEQISNYLNDN